MVGTAVGNHIRSYLPGVGVSSPTGELELDEMASNLSFYLSFDEQGSAYKDISGNGNHFINPANAPSVTTGIWGNAIDFDTDEVLKLDTNNDVSTGDVTWSMSALIKHEGSLNGPLDSIAMMGDPAGGAVEWLLYYDSSTPKTELIIYNGSTTQVATATVNGALSADTWYWLMWGYDADNQRAFLYVNDSSDTGDATGTPGTNANSDLLLGRASPVHSSFKDWDGQFDEVWFVKGSVPTAVQITSLYDDGEGQSWFGYRNLFYGFDSADLVPFQIARMSGVATAPDVTWPQYWVQSYGLRDDITFQNGYFYPITILSGYSGFRFRSVQVLDDDQWASFRVCDEGSWSNGEYIGVFVRQSLDTETFYAALIDGQGIKLVKVVNGAAEVVLVSTTGYTPSVGDLIVLKANGENITVDVAGVTALLEAVDSDIASGVTGVIGSGNQSTNRAGDFRTGSLPMGNLAVSATGWIANVAENADGVAITDDCGGGFDADILFDYNFTNTDSESATHTHYVEIDFGEVRLIDGLRSWSDSTSGSYQYDNVTLKAKRNVGDAWSTLFSNEDLSHTSPAANQWCPSSDGIRFTPYAARYVRVEIASTEEASDYVSMSEWEFHG